MTQAHIYQITFLRHAESFANANGYYQGQFDFELTDKGRNQAQRLAERWCKEQIQFDKIFSSPLSRARETAEIINRALNLPLEFDPVWMERNAGKLSGLHHDEAHTVYQRPAFLNLYQKVGETGESEWELFLRAGWALQGLIDQGPGRYLVVSHGGLLNKVYKQILGIMPQANFQGLRFDFFNTGFGRFEFDRQKNRWFVISINDHQHLLETESLDCAHQFTLIRHAESQGNVERRFQGQAEYPLTEQGKAQALALGKRWQLQGQTFDRIIASPQSRALETAQIIAKQISAPAPVTDPVWKEVHNGKLAGLSIEAIESQQTQRTDHTNMFEPLGENGESWLQFYLRTGEGLKKLMAYEPGHTLLVTHGGILVYLLFNILGINPHPNSHIPSFRFGNTAISRIGFRPEDNQWRLTVLGDQAHIEQMENTHV